MRRQDAADPEGLHGERMCAARKYKRKKVGRWREKESHGT